MDDSPDSRVPLLPAELVNSRIDENRLFEARFLFEKFSHEIDQPLREKIQRQLTKKIELAQQAFSQGEVLEQAGELEKAADSFAEATVLAIDYPELAQARQRVDLSLKLVSSLPDETVEPVKPEPHAASILSEILEVSAAPKLIARKPLLAVTLSALSMVRATIRSFFQQRKNQIVVASSLVVMLGLCSVFFLFRTESEPEISEENVPAKGFPTENVRAAIEPIEGLILPLREVDHFPPAPGVSSYLSEGENLSSPPPTSKEVTGQEPLPEGHEQASTSGRVSVPTPPVVEQKPKVEPASKTVHVRPLHIQALREEISDNHDSDTPERSSLDIYGSSWRLQEMNKLTRKQVASPKIKDVERESRVYETFSAGKIE